MMFLVFILATWAADISVAERAQKLLLNGDRSAATQILVAAAKKDPKYKTLLKNVTQEFITEQGQRLYQLGLSLEFTNPQLAAQRLSEALKLEDQNQLILAALARVLIGLKRCDEAKTDLTKSLKLNPFDTSLIEWQFRSSLCLNDKESAKAQIKLLEKEDLAAWRIKWLRFKLQPSDRSLLEQISREAPSFPEAIYLLWKMTKPLSGAREDLARRYVALCKSLSVQAKADFSFEPELCLHTEELLSSEEDNEK